MVQIEVEYREWFEPVMPDSWIDEEGTKHLVVYGGDLIPEKLMMQKFSDHWLSVEERIPF